MSMKSSLVDSQAFLTDILQVRLCMGIYLALGRRENISGYYRALAMWEETLQLSLHTDNNEAMRAGVEECWVMRNPSGMAYLLSSRGDDVID